MSIGAYCQPPQLSLWSQVVPLACSASETDRLIGPGLDRVLPKRLAATIQPIGRRSGSDQLIRESDELAVAAQSMPRQNSAEERLPS
jgi:hypothetical protein